MSSRFATERVVLAQDDLVDPSQREAVWLLMEWPHGEKAATDFTATTLPANMSRRQLVRRVKQRWRTERVYEDAKESLGWITTRAAPSAAGTTMCPWCWFASRLSSPSAPGFSPSAGKTATRKRRIVTTVRTATRRSGTSGIPSSLCAWPSRASWPHGYPDAPCVTDRDRWDRLVHMPVNTDGRLPF